VCTVVRVCVVKKVAIFLSVHVYFYSLNTFLMLLFSIPVLLDIALTRIYVWIDFLMDMVIFWLQVVPPQQDKNPEVPLEQLMVEQKNNPPKLEFVLNFHQDADIVIVESALMENPTCLVIKFLVRIISGRPLKCSYGFYACPQFNYSCFVCILCSLKSLHTLTF